jgi:tetratricopeptide (TPR) repeat protein
MALAGGVAVAQYPPYTPPPPPLIPGPCKPTKDFPCTPLPSSVPPPDAPADKFPFPGDVPAGDKSAAQNPADPAANPAANQAQKSFPFPEDADKPAAPTTPTPAAKAFPFPGEPDSPASSSSSSSSSSSASADPIPDESDKPALTDKGSSGSTRLDRMHRRLLDKVEDLDKREADDLEVSHYYATTGNFQASYLRAQDAVKTIPDDPLAHFALAESARRLNKKDEAISEYRVYLKLDPEGEKAKAAQRALAELTPK